MFCKRTLYACYVCEMRMVRISIMYGTGFFVGKGKPAPRQESGPRITASNSERMTNDKRMNERGRGNVRHFWRGCVGRGWGKYAGVVAARPRSQVRQRFDHTFKADAELKCYC